MGEFMYLNKLKNNRGFSLIELIVAITIMTVLIAILVPNVVGYIKKSQDAAAKTAASTIYGAATNYVVTKIADGADFSANSQVDASVLWSDGVELLNPLKSSEQAEIVLNETGSAVKYVYYKNGAGAEADYPEGMSGKIVQ